MQAASVLAFQSDFDRGATLDAPIPPGLERAQVRLRMTATLANAAWASAQPRPAGFRLYASVQGDTVADYRRCAKTMDKMAVDGLAIGGLVPRVKRDPQQVIAILEGIRAVTDKPLHAFGIGHPRMVDVLRQRGVASFDSSSPMRAAASGITWGGDTLADAAPLERLRAAMENIASLTGVKVPAVAVRLPEVKTPSPRPPSARALTDRQSRPYPLAGHPCPHDPSHPATAAARLAG